MDDQLLSQTYTIAGQAVQDLSESQATVALAAGAVLDGKFEVLSKLGQGGMGIVYKVRHLTLDRELALKTFSSGSIDQTDWQRFEREVKPIARLKSKNIVQIFDYGTWGERHIPYYAMELLTGESLAERIKRSGAIAMDEVIPLFIDVANALYYASEQGIIHRDIKPANIFLARSGSDNRPVAKLVDFGIAKLVSDPGIESQHLTSTGLIFGSPLYMSPEQALGSPVSFRSDIYSTGCALYEALTGAPPFRGDNAFITMQMHVTAPPPPLPAHLTSSEQGTKMQQVLDCMLAKDSARRFASASDLEHALVSILEPGTSIKLPVQQRFDYTEGLATAVKKPARAVSEQEDVKQDRGKKTTAPLLITLLIVALTGAGIALCNIQPQKHVSQDKSEHAAHQQATATTPSTSSPTQSVDTSTTSLYTSTDNRGNKIINIPSGTRLGQFIWGTSFNGGQKASGQVIVPEQAFLYLRCDDIVRERPELLRGFGQNDLSGLEIGNRMYEMPEAGIKILTEVSRLTGLKALTLIYCALDDRGVELINKLPHLDRLSMEQCDFKPQVLLKLHKLTELQGLTIDSQSGCTPLLSLLARSNTNNMTDLNLKDCQLKDSDLELIARLQRLRLLNLSLDSDLTDDGVKNLLALKQLTYLKLTNCRVSLDLLRKFKQVSHLNLTAEFYSPASRASFIKDMPNCNVEFN